MKHKVVFGFLVALWSAMTAVSVNAWAMPQGPDQQSAQLVRASHIIFVGRVVKTGAVNLKVLAASASTAVVHVDELLDAPPALAGLKDQEVTVELIQAGSAREGQVAVFFTNGILFGEHLEVKEVGSMPAPEDIGALRKEIAAVRAQVENEKIQARAQIAELVITGKVLETKPLNQSRPTSEHDPEWAAAIIEIQEIEKGSHEGRTVIVYFPQSTDERWLLSPKFHSGQQGIWFLHREDKGGLPTGGFFALSPLDFHPIEKREVIRGLIR